MFIKLQGKNAKKAVKISAITLASAAVLSVPFAGTNVQAATASEETTATEQVTPATTQTQEAPQATEAATTTPETRDYQVGDVETEISTDPSFSSKPDLALAQSQKELAELHGDNTESTQKNTDNGITHNADGTVSVKPNQSDIDNQIVPETDPNAPEHGNEVGHQTTGTNDGKTIASNTDGIAIAVPETSTSEPTETVQPTEPSTDLTSNIGSTDSNANHNGVTTGNQKEVTNSTVANGKTIASNTDATASTDTTPASQSGLKTFPQTGEEHNPMIAAFGGLLAMIASVLGFKKRNA
jgi:LPXTG-motif cell wall-anchored protein